LQGNKKINLLQSFYIKLIEKVNSNISKKEMYVQDMLRKLKENGDIIAKKILVILKIKKIKIIFKNMLTLW
jgi:hypothetical protein